MDLNKYAKINNRGGYDVWGLFENPCNNKLCVRNEESMNINKLKIANKSELQITEELLNDYSIDKGQEFEFKGIMGKVNYNDKFSEFKLFYVSTGKGSMTEIIFRSLNCICKTKKLDKYYDLIAEYEHNTCDNVINEICVTGKFIRTPNVIFKITGIVPERIHDIKNINNDWRDRFDYNLFANVAGYINNLVRNSQYDNDDYMKVQEVVEEYQCHFKGLINHLKGKTDANDIMNYQRNYIEELFDNVFMHYGTLKEVTIKLRMILDDIIMMHTGLQTEEYDQMNVLYDVRCLIAMTDISVIIRTLTCIKGVVLSMKDVVLIMLVYVKNFYNDYINRNELDNETIKAYMVYDNKVRDIMEGLCFDERESRYVSNQISAYIRVLKNNI